MSNQSNHQSAQHRLACGSDFSWVEDAGTEQQKLHPIKQQLKVPNIARVLIVHAVRCTGRRPDITMAVEDGEAIVMFEGSTRTRRRTRCRYVKRNLLRVAEIGSRRLHLCLRQ